MRKSPLASVVGLLTCMRCQSDPGKSAARAKPLTRASTCIGCAIGRGFFFVWALGSGRGCAADCTGVALGTGLVGSAAACLTSGLGGVLSTSVGRACPARVSSHASGYLSCRNCCSSRWRFCAVAATSTRARPLAASNLTGAFIPRWRNCVSARVRARSALP